MKTCDTCGVKKEKTTGFRPFKVVGGVSYSNTCRKCYSQRTSERYMIPGVKEAHNLRQRESNQRLKKDVMDHYGGKCSCCGESDVRFLTIDHLEGSGRKDREMIKKGMVSGGSYYYRWIRDTGYPDHLQVLCFNCNSGKMVNGGVCPHKDNYQGKEG